MFDYDALIVNVVDVNPRSETHGEEDVPAVGVTGELTKAQNEVAWAEILAEVAYEAELPDGVDLPGEADILDAKGAPGARSVTTGPTPTTKSISARARRRSPRSCTRRSTSSRGSSMKSTAKCCGSGCRPRRRATSKGR